MGKTLSSSPAWVKASWIPWKNSGSRDGATVATAWRRAGSDKAGMGISGSSPCGYSAVIQPLPLISSNRINRATPRGGIWLFAHVAVGWVLLVTLRTAAGWEGSALCRGPVRGPTHPGNRCNQGYRWHGSVVSVQVAHPKRRAVVLIIRRSWV